MPELPEVETTVRGLRHFIIGQTIRAHWTDWPKYLKLPDSEKKFHARIRNQQIVSVNRLGKNILIGLKNDYTLLVHQKMSGHLMFGRWIKNTDASKHALQKLAPVWLNQKWLPETTNALAEPKNRFIRFILFFKNGQMLALSDLRRFAKIICAPSSEILNLPELKQLGADPTDKNFTFPRLNSSLAKQKNSIKKVLLSQYVLSGIGNIYADEILHMAKIHPLTKTVNLTGTNRHKIFLAMKKILPTATKCGGTSMDDYRNISGVKGNYEKHLRVYHRTGLNCQNCHSVIKKIKISGRSSHFCPNCQKLK